MEDTLASVEQCYEWLNEDMVTIESIQQGASHGLGVGYSVSLPAYEELAGALPSSYSRALGLDTVELLTFLGASQQKKWAKLVALHGSPDLAQQVRAAAG